MNALKHYTRAPITEALIDLRVERSPEVTPSTMKEVQRFVEQDYPTCEDLVSFQGMLQVGASVAVAATQTPIGYRFTSKDQKQVLQAEVNGFVVSRLAPYTGWNVLSDEAQRLWGVYRGIVNPLHITRVAVRYINRLDLPLPLHDFKDYLRTVPEVSPNLSQGLSGYVMHLQIPQEDLNGMLVLNQALVQPLKDDVVSILLDIDVFLEVNLPGNSDAVWALLNQLRVRKNEVFEACITDKTRELIE